jgi:putative membrane protein
VAHLQGRLPGLTATARLSLPSVNSLVTEDDPTRNDLAEDRTILANERTFAGWVRTALALIAIGVGFNALFRTMAPSWVPRGIASGFLLLSVVTILSAERRAALVMERLSPHVIRRARAMNLRLIAAVVSLGATALMAAIWLADFN